LQRRFIELGENVKTLDLHNFAFRTADTDRENADTGFGGNLSNFQRIWRACIFAIRKQNDNGRWKIANLPHLSPLFEGGLVDDDRLTRNRAE
jgi:hypothetical protein